MIQLPPSPQITEPSPSSPWPTRLGRSVHTVGVGAMTRVVPALLYTVLLLASFSGVFSAESSVERLRLLLSAGLWSMFLVLTLIRGRSRNSNRSPLAVMAAVLVHFITVGVGLGGATTGARLLVGSVLLLAGLVFSLVSVTALGRCFGVLADARGLITRGPYRVVRHPLYLGELVAMFGLALGADKLWLTLSTWALVVLIQAVRARYEERTLAEAFPAYEEYAMAVPYRIFPRIY
jgi:protein-S-isoprenylcysteine O-methyltransferase Ste14